MAYACRDGYKGSRTCRFPRRDYHEKNRVPAFVGAGKPALLRLGTMNDADHTWVNGVLVGGRSNVYEPRDYPVAAGVLRAGANEIRMRLVVERPAVV